MIVIVAFTDTAIALIILALPYQYVPIYQR
jgi:hypothetical protein